MDLRKLKTLIDLVSESNVSELEITEGEERVRINRFGPAAPQQREQLVERSRPRDVRGAAAQPEPDVGGQGLISLDDPAEVVE